MNTDKHGLWGQLLFLSLAVLFLIPLTSSAEKIEPPANPREMFQALGVDDGYFDRLADGRPLTSVEDETLLRILFRLRTFPPVDVERWALGSDALAKAIRQPEKSRGDIFHLRGRLLDVESIEPSAQPAQRYELAKYFRCRLQLDAPRRLADVYTENIPDQWRNGAKPGASVGALGVFLKLAQTTDQNSLLVFAAPRLAWYPQESLLGRLGMDFGLFDSVENQKPITASDREAFYQMLAAVGRARPGQLLRQAEENLATTSADSRWTNREGQEQYSIVPLFNEANTQRGRLVELLGTARRIEIILIGNADLIARFGFDHYFQVSLFTEDSEGNPLTFCILDLPEEMPYGNLPRYGETVRIAGFFFKTWNYVVPILADPALSPGDPKTHRQLSPLLIGRSLVWYPAPQPVDRTFSNLLIGGLFFFVMVIIWLAAWQSRRRERKRLDRLETPPVFDTGVDLDQIGRALDGGTDEDKVSGIKD